MSAQILAEYMAMKETVFQKEVGRPDFTLRFNSLYGWVRSVGLDHLDAIKDQVDEGTAQVDLVLEGLDDPQWAIRVLGEWLGENLYGCWDWLKESHPQK